MYVYVCVCVCTVCHLSSRQLRSFAFMIFFQSVLHLFYPPSISVVFTVFTIFFRSNYFILILLLRYLL